MKAIDFNKPLVLVQTACPATKPKSIEMTTTYGSKFFFKNPAGRNFWLGNPDGTIEDHPQWRIMNVAPPPVVHEATVVWYRRFADDRIGVAAFSQDRERDCEYFISNIKDHFLKKEIVTITV